MAEWENIQIRVFTRWTNAHLRKRNMVIETDLITELEDGVKLLNLYEIISNESLGKYYQTPKTKIHKIENLTKTVKRINEFVGSVGIKTQYSAEQVQSGDKRSILGMIWCLIHKFEIQDISEEELSARDGLLLWCKKKTAGYKDVKVDNFNFSWEDGLAFCALIHKHRPDLLDFDSLSKDNKRENLQLAFEVADKHLDIPQLLDVDDMLKYKPDDKAVMTYVAYYWKKFASSNANEKAARKIANIAKLQQELLQMQHDYERRAGLLLGWIAEATSRYQSTAPILECNSLEKVMGKFTEFKTFKNSEKPSKGTEKADLELLLTSIRSKQKSEGLPVYDPPHDLSTPAINSQWDVLGGVQEQYDQVLSKHVALMKRLEILLGRFRSRSQKILSWQEVKSGTLTSEDPMKLTTVSAAHARVKTNETFQDELASVNKSLAYLNQIGSEIVQSNHEGAPEVQTVLEAMNTNQKIVVDAATALSQKLEARLKFLEEIVGKCLEYARKAEQLNLFIEDANLTLTEPVRATSVQDVEAFEANLLQIDNEHAQNKQTVQDLGRLAKEITEAGAQPTEYSSYNLEQVVDAYLGLRGIIDSKKKELGVEKTTQEGRAASLNEYTQLSSAYSAFVNASKNQITEVIDAPLEKQLEALRPKSTKFLQESNQKYEQLETLYRQLEAQEVSEQAPITLQALSIQKSELQNVVQKRLNDIEQQLIAKTATGISTEQVNEYRDTFNHFDKDRDGELSKLDFKACLSAIGEDIPDAQLEKVFATLDADNNGKIDFNEFLNFMIGQSKDEGGYTDVLLAFQQLAAGSDYVTEAALRQAMQKDEVDYLITVMPATSEGYDYKAYLNNTFQRS